MTLEELKERIDWSYDVISIVELLDISSEEILNRFTDKVEDRFDELSEQFGEEADED